MSVTYTCVKIVVTRAKGKYICLTSTFKTPRSRGSQVAAQLQVPCSLVAPRCHDLCCQRIVSPTPPFFS
ncbi:hypothetical protein J6590_040735 [Homalodisca vitripennis]|nr:hypothetical protein J6590_040735 [Homalodisca vitripennis]